MFEIFQLDKPLVVIGRSRHTKGQRLPFFIQWSMMRHIKIKKISGLTTTVGFGLLDATDYNAWKALLGGVVLCVLIKNCTRTNTAQHTRRIIPASSISYKKPPWNFIIFLRSSTRNSYGYHSLFPSVNFLRSLFDRR